MSKSWLSFAKRHPRVVLYGLILVAALVWQLSEILMGWDHVILAHHGFRQTQTAVSAYYFSQDGLGLYPVVPVLGPPWILPSEFPLYQWIVALFHSATDVPIDQSGRTVSLFFHYTGLLLTGLILRQMKVGATGILSALILVTLSPLATYWAQGVLIESISVSTTLLYVLLAIHTQRKSGRTNWIPAVLIGSLAAMIKVTAFAVGWGFLILYWIYKHIEIEDRIERYRIIRYCLLLGLPLACAALWIHHTNVVLEQLILAPDVMSNFDWYFGGIIDRLNQDEWNQILKNTVLWAFGSPLPLLMAILPFSIPHINRGKVLVPLGAALSGPAVFWGVYYVHDYYAYEIIFFACMAIGICFEEALLKTRSSVRYGIMGLQLILFGTMVGGYYHTPYAWLFRHDHLAEQSKFFEELATDVPSESFIVVAGFDWDPRIAYVTHRETMMIRWIDWIRGDHFMNAYDQMLKDGYSCGGIIVNTETVSTPDQQLILEKLKVDPIPDRDLDSKIYFYQN